MAASRQLIYFRKQYSFPAAHFLQYSQVLHARVGKVLISFLQARDPDPRVLTPRQLCVAMLEISKPTELVDYSVSYLNEKIRGDRRAAPPRIQDLPPKVAGAAQSISQRLDDSAIALAKSLRWRCNAHGTARVFKDIDIAPFEFSLDARTWLPVYGWSLFEQIEWHYEYLDTVLDPEDGTYEALPGEPLAFELLMEARQLQYENPRSALVIAVAAAEIGTKRCLQSIHPGLTEVLQSSECPPILDLLDSYYPKHTEARIVPWITGELEKAVSERNRLVHQGIFALKRAQLRRRLRAIEDLLRLLDVHAGFPWAKTYLSERTRNDLGLPKLPLH